MSEKARRAKFEAYIGHYQTYASYLESYKHAFDVLIQHVENNSSVNIISYPTLFIARQCMELGFKANIKYFHKYSKVDNHIKGNTHYLRPLMESFRVHISKTIENLKKEHGIVVDKNEIAEFDQYFAKLEKLTDIFEILDKGSDALRYPVNKDGEKSFKHSQTINVLDVAELLEETMVLFRYTADVFSKYTDYVDEIEKYYEEQMRELYNE